MATDICLPVLKYSHAVGVRSDNTIPWTHITASDLYILVKGVNASVLDAQLSLRVVQGNKVLENVDIADYIEQSLEMRRRAQHAGIPIQETQLPIFGITKDASLALRYRLSDGQARRFQVRFKTTSECSQVVNIFTRRGMQFQEQKPRTARPGSVRLGTDSSQTRPLTVQTDSPYFTPAAPAPKLNPFTQHEVLEAGCLSEHQRSPDRSPKNEFAGAFETMRSPSRQFAPQPFITRDEYPYEAPSPGEDVVQAASTRQSLPSHVNPPSQFQYEQAGGRYRSSAGEVERNSTTSQILALEASYAAPQQLQSPNRDTAVNVSTRQESHPNQSTSSAVTAPEQLSSDPVSSRPQTARPSTSISFPHPDTLEHLIPPRRELPFPRPESRSSAPSLDLPPLPHPKTLRKGTLLTKSRRPQTSSATAGATPDASAPSRPTTASPSKRSFATLQSANPRPETAVGTVNQTWSVEAVPKIPMPPPTSPISGMRELLQTRKPLEERSTNTSNKVPRLNSLADAPHEIVSPPPTATTHSSPSKSAEPVTSSSTLTALSTSSASFQLETASLEGFSGLQNAEQQQLLDDFFAANWNNPDFEALCAAVEGCWRRIAVGL